MITITHSHLSESHYRLWLLTQPSASGSLNIVLSIGLAGPLNVSALEASLADVIERHHSLRTGIRDQAGEPVPFLHTGAVARPRLSAVRPTPASISMIVQTVQQKFSLDEEIPLRAHLLAHAPTQHTLYLIAHPMALDHWSVRSLLSDLVTSYGCRCRGSAVRWPNPAPQYSDYLLQQRLTIGEECDLASPAARQLAFWTRTLHDAPPINLPLPQTPATGSPDGIPVRLNPEIHRRLLLLGASSQANLLMVLHSIILLVLSRLTGNSDLVIGTLVSGRKHGFFRDIVGSLANVINVRTDIQRNESLRTLLRRVREAYIEAYANSDLEWGRVVEACGGGSDPNAPPAGVMLTIQKRSRCHFSSMNVAGVKVENHPMFPFMFGCNLAFEFVEWCGGNGDPQGIEGRVRCNFSKVDKAFITLLRTEFLEMLRTVLDLPGRAGDEQGRFDRDSTLIQALVGDGSAPCLPASASGSASLSPDRKKHDLARSRSSSFIDPFRVHIGGESVTPSRLIQIWEEVLGVQRIGIWDNFFDLGGDESLFARMMTRISAIYREDISIQCQERYITVAELSAQLAQRVPLAPTIEIQAGDPRKNPPFWFLHGDFHGRGLYCRELSTFLDRNQPFHVLPPHGINGRAVPGSIEEMAPDCIESIHKVQPHGPFFLGGFCNGGRVALETAAQLLKAGEDVAAVILVDSQLNPNLQRPRLKEDNSVATAGKSSKARSTPELSLRMNADDMFVRYTKTGELYSPQPYPGKVFLLCPSEKPYPAYDPVSAWRHVIEDLTVRWIPGGHLTALTRHVGSLGTTLADSLATARKAVKV